MIETWDLLPKAFYWVHEFEAGKYKKAHPGIKIKPLPDDIKGNVARVRNYILNNQPQGIDVTVQIDDDFIKIGYWDQKEQTILNSEKEIREMIIRYSYLARDLGVMLWGMNVNCDKQVYREYTPFSMLSYISASFSCFMRGNDLFYDEKFSLKEDYDMTIQQILKYRKVLRLNKYFYLKKGAEQTGGCATYRNVKKEISQIKQLQKKWGSHIVKYDFNTRSHSSNKIRKFDINPVVTVPIRGV
jgi:hypothetical protein